MTASGGHSRHSDYVDDRSAMPELRTSASAAGMSQLCHEPTLARLFDHLVGAEQQGRANDSTPRARSMADNSAGRPLGGSSS
jgi:hypothetical protein